ncbi:MAG TPA: D-alanyl-D-alanine carboxypeptidase, partial [Naasia sp.]
MTTPRDPDAMSDLAEWLQHAQPHVDDRSDAERKTRRLRTLKVVAIVLAILLAAAGGYVAWALTAPLSSPT